MKSSQLGPVSEVPLSWSRQDIEQRLAFHGGRYTRVNTFLSALLAGILTVAFYAILIPLDDTYFSQMFTARGLIPYFICFFTAWSLSILLLKSRKLALQKKRLQHGVVTTDHDFVLSNTTVDVVIENN